MIPDFNKVKEAHSRIKPYINRTLVLSSRSINEIAGCSLFFKCENFQRVGAFKFRGATNAVFSLSDEEAQRGVATHSSGNHAQALSLAAKMRGTKAYIVMPENSSAVKINATRGYGAEIVFCKPTLAARESTLDEVVRKTGAVFIHPYNNPNIIAGQATAAMELLEETNNLDVVIAPCGGGGLLSGTSISCRAMLPSAQVYGAEPLGAADAKASLDKCEIVPSNNPHTVCDGLLTSLGDMTFPIIKENVNDILLADDETIKLAMKLVWERMKIVVEPSSAITMAVVLLNKKLFEGKKVGLIISGGNVDLNKWKW